MKHEDENAIDYLRRIIDHLNSEPEYILEKLPTTKAVVEYFELFSAYDTDYLSGCLESIMEGADPGPLTKFNQKYRMGWAQTIREAAYKHKAFQKTIK